MHIEVKTQFEPDYRNVLPVVAKERRQRLPLYEHHIDLPFIGDDPKKTEQTCPCT